LSHIFLRPDVATSNDYTRSCMFILVALTVALFSEKIAKAEKKLLDYQEQLRKLASELSLTEERQRRQIAADLHDRIGQNLAASKINLKLLQESISSADDNRRLSQIIGLVDQTIQDTWSLTFELSPPMLYELGFEAAVEWLVNQFQQKYNIAVVLDSHNKNLLLDDDVRGFLFRSVGELLINITKHARAQNVEVSIKKDKKIYKVSVKDDGVGFDVPKFEIFGGEPGDPINNITVQSKW